MNDSFLEDLELESNHVKNVNYTLDRHVTTRAASSPLQLPLSKGEGLRHRTEPSPLSEKHSIVKEVHAKDPKKLSEQDARKQQMKVKMSERKEKSVESKLKPIENKVKVDEKEHEIKDDIKAKIRETRVKISDIKVAKDRSRRSGSCKENNQTPDVCVKENNRPPECSRESVSQVEVSKDKGRTSDYVKKSDPKESDTTALLNAIQDIVGMHAKQESTKILRAMQELHFSAQANLIKHLLTQTDDLISEMHPSKDSNRVRCLVEQNDRLKEDIVILQKRNEDLQKRLEELEFLKQENIALKLKCKELSKH